ncbi:hypothetical protein N24_1496 [Corynebacterium suranareeae]|uniref:Uncharacterized protein n=1 Tax=Corynebacterium suranareeae TaxID=2506452 RepID=A0A169RW38_9CORY|nr:hypothetical protein [Corynebacterium suranareeae]BAU95758.1 hypothetical protein N24_1496 [Corynebacterium suranareeae]
MPTNNAGSFFFSRKNLAGIAIATLIIALHLLIGLGVFWPIVAVAGYGAAVALIPSKPQQQASIPTLESPATLAARAKELVSSLSRHGAATPAVEALDDLNQSLQLVIENWSRLNNFPEHQVTIRSIINQYIPGVIDAYLSIPTRNDPRAVEDLIESFTLLNSETMKIFNAIQEQGLNNLEDHGRALRMQFGQLPEDFKE